MRTATTTELLNGLKDSANAAVWGAFDARFRPVIQGMCLRLGLRPEDAADVAQQTLADFLRDYQAGKFDRGRGRLRSWIIGIAHNRAMEVFRGQSRRREWRGDSAIGTLPQRTAAELEWDSEEKRLICEAALAEMRESSAMSLDNFRAFELTAMRNMSHEAAASECGMSVQAVYQAKHRGLRRLGEIIERLKSEYDDAG
jgi:RNA polymerase sigma factor (sigma-70 family)